MTLPVRRLAGLSRSFLALGAANYGAMAISFGISVLLARRLGAEQYGRLALMLMVSQVLLLVAVNWSHTGFVQFGAREFASTRTVADALWTRLGILLPLAAVGAMTLVLGRGPLAAYLGIPVAGVWLILMHFLAACALSVAGAVFQASDEMGRYGVSMFLDKALMLACVVGLPAAWTHSPLVVLGCYAVSSLSVAIWGLSVVRARTRADAWPSRVSLRRMALFSAPLLLSSWAGFFGASWFDLVILKRYESMSGIGLYSLATQLAGVAQQVTIIFSTLLLPHLSVMVAERQDAQIRTFLERLLPYWLLGTSIVFSVILIGARAGVPLVFGESFGGAAPVLALLMVATAALALFNACTPLVTAYGSTWALTGICLLSALTNVVVDLLLIPRFGIEGSAMATTVAYGTSAGMVLLFVQRRVGGRVLRLAWLGTPVLVAAVCFSLFDGVWFYAVATVASTASVVALVGAFRLFHTEDAVFLAALRPRLPFNLGDGMPAGRRP